MTKINTVKLVNTKKRVFNGVKPKGTINVQEENVAFYERN
jgi:hypothetical protein